MNDLGAIWFTLGDHPVRVSEAIAFGVTVAAVGILVLSIVLILQLVARSKRAAEADAHARDLEVRLAELSRTQSEMTGRMQTMAEVFGTRQADLAKGLREQLDGFGHRLGQNAETQARATHENLSRLNERLAVIDAAQKNITELSRDVVGLQDILANKQKRGAFGQGRMEAIIADALPASAFTLQATLSNNKRPDCLIHMPNDAPSIVVDAKFPLEALHAFRDAETEADRKSAFAQLRTDMGKHIQDIAERYLIPGETYDTALMFVPSEAIYADLHEHFDDVIQKATRARVIIVGPSLLMLSVQTIQAILRDQRMREQAHVIQHEVAKLSEDVTRMEDRVLNLQKHFGQLNSDIDQILISSQKIGRHSVRIVNLELGEMPQTQPVPAETDSATIAEPLAEDDLPKVAALRSATGGRRKG
ncbi:MAG: DNA recombination protein RmuC [Pseudomonadota bacterium]